MSHAWAGSMLKFQARAGPAIVSLEAAHISNVEQPKAYTEAVLNFLKG